MNTKDMSNKSVNGSRDFDRWDRKENDETREHALNHDNITIVVRTHN